MVDCNPLLKPFFLKGRQRLGCLGGIAIAFPWLDSYHPSCLKTLEQTFFRAILQPVHEMVFPSQSTCRNSSKGAFQCLKQVLHSNLLHLVWPSWWRWRFTTHLKKIVKQILYHPEFPGETWTKFIKATMKPLNESQYMCVYTHIYIYMYVYDDYYFFSNKLLFQHLLLRTWSGQIK